MCVVDACDVGQKREERREERGEHSMSLDAARTWERVTSEMGNWDRECAVMCIRWELFASHSRYEFEKQRRLESRVRPRNAEKDEERRYHEHVLSFARGVAFAMWVSGDAEFPAELQREMSAALSGASDFLLDVCIEARQMHAVWRERGHVTDDRVVEQLAREVLRDAV